MEFAYIAAEDVAGLGVFFFDHGYDEPVDFRCGMFGAGQGGVAAQVLVGDGFQGHHVEIF